jgi:DnaJ-class molecular chaperone
MSLYKQYHTEINKWNWQGIVYEAKYNQEWDSDNEDGYKIGMSYLGSLINPSGKYYLPFACSNLDLCHSCKGTGNNPHKTEECPICNGIGKRFISVIKMQGYTAILDNINMGNIQTFMGEDGEYFICHNCNGNGFIRTICKQCGGLGSNEAYKDQEFYTALDDIASKHGGYITSGEGDPCDIFFCISIENKELTE